ncbi:MAG: hypothetical protein NTY36_03575 [Deltaproteobacteria bacterium]|nr:hypothetical protein [Deltaproteobacteria bacterium]
MNKRLILFLMLCTVLVPSLASAKLIGVSWSLTDSPVVTIKEADGSGQTLGASGFPTLNALARDDKGALYSVSDDKLIKIDPVTGQGSFVVNLNLGATPPNVRGLAFYRSSMAPISMLYAINCRPGSGIQPHDLYVINPATGTGSLVGPNGDDFVIQDIALSSTGVLYGWDVIKGLVTINRVTGAATVVNPAMPGTVKIQGIAFGPDGLYGAGDALYKISMATGAYTRIGGGSYSDVRGIAFFPDVTLIGVSWDYTNSPVVGINQATGTGYTIGPSGYSRLNSLAKDKNGLLYSVSSGQLITINPNTGQGTPIAALSFPTYPPDVRGLAFSPTGVLYAINCRPGSGLPPHDLYTIDPTTGAGTYIGPNDHDGLTFGIQDIAFSPDGILYGWDVTKGLVTIDTATGYATANPGWVGTADIQGIAFAPDGTLYGAGNGLYKINTTTGAYTLVGSGGYTDVRGIAFVTVLPPSSLIGASWSFTDSPVVRINQTTGTGSTIGLSGYSRLNSLAKDSDGVLYSVSNNQLIKIDPNTGKGTLVVTLTFPTYPPDVRGLTFSPSGVLYAINCRPGSGLPPHDLYTINLTTGVGTYIGPNDHDGLTFGIQDIAFSPDGTTLYGWDVTKGLVTINPATGNATAHPGWVGTADIQGIVFAPDGALYGAGNGLYKINTTTGAYTMVGSGGYTDLRGLQFLTNRRSGSVTPAVTLLLF